MVFIRLLCIDVSSSTHRTNEYEARVLSFAQTVGSFHYVLTWASRCREINDIPDKLKSEGDTRQPQTFLKHIVNALPTLSSESKIELYVTTHGDIEDADITECLEYVDEMRPHLAFVHVYYFGVEMNFGLTAVFGSVKQLWCSVYDVHKVQLVLTLNELHARIDDQEIYADNFIMSVVTRVKYAQVLLKSESQQALKAQLSKMRVKLLKLLDYKPNTLDAAFVRDCYERNDGELLEKAIKQNLLMADQKQRIQRRFLILSVFDPKSNVRLVDVFGQKDDVKSVAESAAAERTSSSVAEDGIKLENIDPETACVWIQIPPAPTIDTYELKMPMLCLSGIFAVVPPEMFPDYWVRVDPLDPSKGWEPGYKWLRTPYDPIRQLYKLDRKAYYARNPFALLEDEALCVNVFKHMELRKTTVGETLKCLQTNSENKREFRSAFTKCTCRMFVVDPCDPTAIDANCFAIASMFEEGDTEFIYQNKFVWNFVMLHLLRTHLFRVGEKGDRFLPFYFDITDFTTKLDAALRKFYFSESVLYPLTLHMNFTLPFKAELPFYIVLWYLCHVAPSQAENTPRNILRLPGMRPLFHIYKYYGHRPNVVPQAQITFLQRRVDLWRLWNALFERRDDPELEFIVRASYQNNVEVEGKVVLLSGRLRGSAPRLVVGYPPAVIMHLYNLLITHQGPRYFYEELFSHENFSNYSERLDIPVAITLNDESDKEEPSVFPFHMKIDLDTCKPSKICPVTKNPIEECAPKFDRKSGSFARVFYLYCSQNNAYPKSASQLVILHNRQCAKNKVSTRHIQVYMNHVFEMHREVMKEYSCDEYLKIYKRH